MFAHQKNRVSIISVFNEFPVFFSATHAAVIFALLFFTSIAQAGQASLAWDLDAKSALGSYKLSYGISGNYSSTVRIGRQTVYITANLQDGIEYYFAAVAYNTTMLKAISRMRLGEFGAGQLSVIPPSRIAANVPMVPVRC